VPKGAAQTVVDEATLILPLADVIDLEQERARLTKEAAEWADEIRKVEVKLANKDFVDVRRRNYRRTSSTAKPKPKR